MNKCTVLAAALFTGGGVVLAATTLACIVSFVNGQRSTATSDLEFEFQ